MNNLISILTKLSFSLVLFSMMSCGPKKDEHGHDDHADEHGETWKEMDDFHMIMAKAFHPYKDSKDLAPAKQNAPAMAEAAAKWADATPPEKADNAAFKEKLSLLKAGCADFVNITQSGDTTQISESLVSLHDLFHEIQDSWYGHDHSGHDHNH
jgi:hypothetical protein